MTPEVRGLLLACGMSDALNEFVEGTLSANSCELTNRLRLFTQQVQRDSGIFLELKREDWYVVMPTSPLDFPHCIQGRELLDFLVVFPDPIVSSEVVSREELTKQEEEYVFSYYRRLLRIYDYGVMLSRTHRLQDVDPWILGRIKEQLIFAILCAGIAYDEKVPTDQDLTQEVKKMQDCLKVIENCIGKK